MEAIFEIINRAGKWEDYVNMEQEDGDATIDEIYTQFYWGNDKITYGRWLLNNFNEAENYDE